MSNIVTRPVVCADYDDRVSSLAGTMNGTMESIANSNTDGKGKRPRIENRVNSDNEDCEDYCEDDVPKTKRKRPRHPTHQPAYILYSAQATRSPYPQYLAQALQSTSHYWYQAQAPDFFSPYPQYWAQASQFTSLSWYPEQAPQFFYPYSQLPTQANSPPMMYHELHHRAAQANQFSPYPQHPTQTIPPSKELVDEERKNQVLIARLEQRLEALEGDKKPREPMMDAVKDMEARQLSGQLSSYLDTRMKHAVEERLKRRTRHLDIHSSETTARGISLPAKRD
ncbi:hypothetical protein SBOR_1944 [Sclerotinia borealis F-4128]|uniref:Uncharacterized protein n=1 Tax=Sclerotinia borealis (strain F-4128) TaxID=1432307 RepID=W9CLI4_SCLBF|nr:hypothetical protein SBOR_1944 [Sclerotinia borealis F-4128]